MFNNTQKLSTSQNTQTSDEQIILKDEDIDKLLKIINKDKKDKLKKIQKNEDNEYKYRSNYNYNYKKNPNYKRETNEMMTKSDLLEKIKRNDFEIRDYLMKLMYSNLVDKNSLTKNKGNSSNSLVQTV